MTASAVPQPAQNRDGQLCILLATRGHPEMLAQVFVSLATNTVRKDKTSVYVDEDDQIARSAIEQRRFPTRAYTFTGHQPPLRLAAPNSFFNAMQMTTIAI